MVSVDFNGVTVDTNGDNIPTGTATATYFANAHALASFSVPVAGGPRSLRSDPGTFTVHRIEGVGYNDPAAAADLAATKGAGSARGAETGKAPALHKTHGGADAHGCPRFHAPGRFLQPW